jgi:hypothetical protein
MILHHSFAGVHISDSRVMAATSVSRLADGKRAALAHDKRNPRCLAEKRDAMRRWNRCYAIPAGDTRSVAEHQYGAMAGPNARGMWFGVTREKL